MQVMPYEGGFLEQPAKTMEALGIIQTLFSEKLKEEFRNGKGRI